MNLIGDAVSAVEVDVDDGDGGTGYRERVRDRLADAGPAAGNERDLTVEDTHGNGYFTACA
ncbi:MAG TPA: hypothetical protein VGL52_10975, partial [Casimicrobiaceae bacterium]